jgi:hypothetical protein
MIKFEGISPTTGNMALLKFSNDAGFIVEIPIDKAVAQTISLHIKRIQTTTSKVVERGNDEAVE